MQCARSLFLWQGRSWLRKGLEAYYTFWMETLLPKRRILELYANVIEMGDGVYGVEAAAHAHYSVNARDLSREQCATLAAILPNPRVWDPRSPTPRLATRIAHLQQQEKQVSFPQLPAR
jgi:monofunctional biosynthetic peptidoglycan transglycosylase